MVSSISEIQENFERFETFDWSLYGCLVRKRRVELGFKRAEDFAYSVWRRSRVNITRDVLYKIEQGKQVPDGMQFLALNLALYGELLPQKTISICTGANWNYIVSESRRDPDGMPHVPYEWARENWDACQVFPELFEGGDAASLFEAPPYQ